MPRDADSTDRQEHRLDRRSVLGAVGATVTAAALSGTAAADRAARLERRRKGQVVKSRYDTASAVEEAFETHASDLLAGLADRGLLDRGDADALDFEDPVEVPAYHDALDRGESAVHVGALDADDDTVTAHISTSVWTDEGRLSVHVRPEAGEAHAIHHGDDDTTIFEATGDGLEPQKRCVYQCECSNDACSSGLILQHYKEYCCEQPDGSINCSYTGSTCLGCCDGH